MIYYLPKEKTRLNDLLLSFKDLKENIHSVIPQEDSLLLKSTDFELSVYFKKKGLIEYIGLTTYNMRPVYEDVNSFLESLYFKRI